MIALAALALLVGCSGSGSNATPTPTFDPLALVTEAANNIRSAATFRISVTQTGPDYALGTEYGTAVFHSATAQYVAPREMQANVRVGVAGLPIQIDVFSRGADQWYRAIWTGNQWLNQPFQEGFNPETLISADAGIQSALDSLIQLSYVGEEQLESGANVHHLLASANGPDVSALLGGLIEPVGEVTVDVFVDTTTRQPARFVIQEFNSPFAATPEAGAETEPVVWTIDVYDIDAPAELDTPPENTAEAPAASPGFVGAPSMESTVETTDEAASAS
jgi:hypothetical protein